MQAAWVKVRDHLRAVIGAAEYDSWLKRLGAGPFVDGELVLHLPSRFLCDWVRDKYGARIKALLAQEEGSIKRIAFKVTPRTKAARQAGKGTKKVDPQSDGAEDTLFPEVEQAPDLLATMGEGAFAAHRAGQDQPAHGPDDPGVMFDPRFTFDTFVVGRPNEVAYACARRVAESPATPGFNPLFLYGGVGLGKTHLMHAIGADLIERGKVSVSYMSAEKFMYRFIASIRSQSTMEFKRQLRSVDVLMIDDFQFLIGKDNTQEEFFHTFNALIDAGRQIVVSADKSPSDLSGLEDRLRTRLGCGMVADLHDPTFELRLSILVDKIKGREELVPAAVLEFLAHRIDGSVRELVGALNRLIAHAELVGRPVNLETAQHVLRDLLAAHERTTSIEEIQRRVAEHWNVRVTDMISSRRVRTVARPRQAAMYLAKQLTPYSLPDIGRAFGNRDHTTVMHAIKAVGTLMAKDAEFRESMEMLNRLLG
ncbi:chromosomal replication initiator protein DnaA [Formicincola oecophyllae]|uniref:chromosomal replication initiator protein DnaA n=1 Tax=Formicincola oecophyllae TaxID=2558361 RepID=UPI001F100D44|nr:chromosomal replication initiator protein DnaA [Formicincola oecophyllae]